MNRVSWPKHLADDIRTHPDLPCSALPCFAPPRPAPPRSPAQARAVKRLLAHRLPAYDAGAAKQEWWVWESAREAR